jgi:Rieske Fe-S protein
VPAESVVVTQPEAGRFRCFSSICTHAGCPVAAAGTTLRCPCHGSEFSIADGSVLVGPATRSLPPREITVTGGDVRLA